MLRRIALIGLVLFSPVRAEAALTDSEKLQIATFVTKGDVAKAQRVRALVARPDLTPEEAAEPLKRGFSAAPFDDARRRFAEELLFGPGSAASRSTLLPPLVEALLARAAARMADIPPEPKGPLSKGERAAAEEVLGIHAFVDRRIANFGNPPAEGHDVASSIHDDAWRAAAQAERAHRTAHARWLTGGAGAVPAEIVHLRAQSALTLVDLARGVAGRREIGEWLGLGGARREAFDRYGVLVESTAPDERIAQAIRIFEAVPGSLDGASLLVLSKASPAGISARGTVAYTGVELGGAPRAMAAAKIWPAEVKASAPDIGLAEVADTAARLGVSRAFATRPEIVTRARAAAGRATASGALGYLAMSVVGMALEGDRAAPRAPSSAEVVMADAVKLLLLDGQRALDLALIRASEGHPEPLEQFATALAILAGNGARASLGRTREGGSIEPVPVTDVKVEEGVATGFVLGGKRITVLAAKGGAFQARVDGAAPKLTSLSSFRERTAENAEFRAGKVPFETLFGSPKGASLDDGRLVVDGSKGGFDALVTGQPMNDGEITARVVPHGSGGGLLLRATAGDLSSIAVALLVSKDAPRARLIVFDGRGKAFDVVELAALPPEVPKDGYAVSLGVVGSTVGAKIDGKAFVGNLPMEITQGRAGLAVLSGGRLDVRDVKVQACAPVDPTAKSAGTSLTPTGFCPKPPPGKGRR